MFRGDVVAGRMVGAPDGGDRGIVVVGDAEERDPVAVPVAVDQGASGHPVRHPGIAHAARVDDLAALRPEVEGTMGVADQDQVGLGLAAEAGDDVVAGGGGTPGPSSLPGLA